MNHENLAGRALRELQERGLNKGNFLNVGGGGEVCLGGAFLIVLEHDDKSTAWVTFHDQMHKTGNALTQIIRELFPGRVPCAGPDQCGWKAVFRFNDHPQTTQEDAELVLKHFIEQENTLLWCTAPHATGNPAGSVGKSSPPVSAGSSWQPGSGSGYLRSAGRPPPPPSPTV